MFATVCQIAPPASACPDGSYASQCPLCGKPLHDPIFSTAHFIADEKNELWRYSDASLHWDCYAAWPKQAEFASLFFDKMTQAPPSNYWPVLYRENLMVVRYGVVVQEVSIFLRKSGTDIRVLREDWVSWLAGRWAEWAHHEIERMAIEEQLEALRRIAAPSQDSKK